MHTKKSDGEQPPTNPRPADEQPPQEPATDDGSTTGLGLVDEPRRIEGEQENPAPEHERTVVETYPEYLERTGTEVPEQPEPAAAETYPEYLERKGTDKK